MPTIRGWIVCGAGIAVAVAGAALGTDSLQQLGVGVVALVAAAVLVVRLSAHELIVGRAVTPERATTGQRVTLALRVANRGLGPAPVVLLADRLPPGLAGTARVAFLGIRQRSEAEARVELRASRRGRYAIGPLDVSYLDPFGLARRNERVGGRCELVVYPRIEPLVPGRDLGDRRSAAAAALKQPTVARGEDFYTLREYAEGDDLRRIHWPSTARSGRYMIRQEEIPWHTRATILLDDRAGAYGGGSDRAAFERAVEAAASLLDLYHRSGYGYRIVAPCAGSLPAARGAAHFGRCLDLLAVVEAERAAAPDALGVKLRELENAAVGEASLVVVTGSPTAGDAIALTRARRVFRQVAVVCLPAHRFGSRPTRERWDGERAVVETAALLERSAVRVVVLGPDESFARAWAAAGDRRTGGPWVRKPELV